MRSHHSSPTTLLFLLSALLLLSATARADDGANDDEYEEHARVLRVSLIKGEVTLQRAGADDWEQAQLNLALVEGDTLATGRDARLEIQADARNFIRVGENAVVRVVTLRDEGIALSLSEGTATVRLAQFERDKEYFEVDAPKTTVAAERTGQYRIDVDPQSVRVTVRGGGRARVYSETSGFELRSDRTARLTYGGDADEDDWELSAAAAPDDWDDWNSEREDYLASHLRYEGRERYYDPEVYGAEELDSYGDWQYTSDYGYVWRPSTTFISSYNDWAPYRYGHWDWCQPYGWTWVADEPWGWAPYHYGRWVYHRNNWCWAPRGYGYRYRHAWWRPALVAFVNVDFGGERHVSWYPLTYGQRDPRGRWWSRRFEVATLPHGREVDRLPRARPWLTRAVTSVPARDFGAGQLRPRPADTDIAQRALSSEPMRGGLPFTRGGGGRREGRDGGGREGRVGDTEVRAAGASGREVLTINRPAPVMPARALPERPTGATSRTPGVPLDEGLRRTHVFNNRQPRVAPPSTGGLPATPGGGAATGAATGVFERPRTDRRQPTFVDNGDRDVTRERRGTGVRGGESGETTRAHPARSAPPAFDNPGERRAFERPTEERPREKRPAASPSYKPESLLPPADSGGRERPSPPAERERTPRRDEQPSYRPERPPTYESRPARVEPPPRQEQPRREAPRREAPRQERPASHPSRASERPAKTERSDSGSERRRP